MAENLISVRVDDKQMTALANRMGIAKKKLPGVVSSAIRKTAGQARTVIKYVVRLRVPQLPAGQIHKRTFIKPKSTRSRLSSVVNIALGPIPLKKIKGVKGKGRYRGKKGRSSYISWRGREFPHAFRATMPSGHMGIYMRKFSDSSKPILTWSGGLLGTGEPGKGLPIQELGVSVGDVYHNAPGVKKKIDKTVTIKLRKNIVNQFNRLMR